MTTKPEQREEVPPVSPSADLDLFVIFKVETDKPSGNLRLTEKAKAHGTGPEDAIISAAEDKALTGLLVAIPEIQARGREIRLRYTATFTETL